MLCCILLICSISIHDGVVGHDGIMVYDGIVSHGGASLSCLVKKEFELCKIVETYITFHLRFLIIIKYFDDYYN